MTTQTTGTDSPPKYHLNNDNDFGKCDAKEAERCPYRDNPHGSLNHVCTIAEQMSNDKFAPKYARKKARREAYEAKRAQKMASEKADAKKLAQTPLQPLSQMLTLSPNHQPPSRHLLSLASLTR